MNEIIVNIEPREIRYARLSNGRVVDLLVKRKNSSTLSGNIYKGKIKNILTNINSAFVSIKENENGFIQLDDLIDHSKSINSLYKLPQLDFLNNIDNNLDTILDRYAIVQVKKEPLGTKGARLTSLINLPGRYVVLIPGIKQVRISKKITNVNSRDRIKSLSENIRQSIDIGVIYRTSSEKVSNDIIEDEVMYLISQWEQILSKFNLSSENTNLYEAKDILTHAIFKAMDFKATKLIVDDVATYKDLLSKYEKYRTEHQLSIDLYTGQIPIFDCYNIEKEISKALNRKVNLPSGGYIFFESTEAMHTIDVNSGRSGSIKTETTEDNILNINLEAAQELTRQIRIRNIGGIIACDFIDMQSIKNRNKIIDTIRTGLKHDEAKCQILKISKFGTLQITRQRIRESLSQIMFEKCPCCKGSGEIKNPETVLIEIQRAIKKTINYYGQKSIRIYCNKTLHDYVAKKMPEFVDEIFNDRKVSVNLYIKPEMHINDFEIA